MYKFYLLASLIVAFISLWMDKTHKEAKAFKNIFLNNKKGQARHGGSCFKLSPPLPSAPQSWCCRGDHTQGLVFHCDKIHTGFTSLFHWCEFIHSVVEPALPAISRTSPPSLTKVCNRRLNNKTLCCLLPLAPENVYSASGLYELAFPDALDAEA